MHLHRHGTEPAGLAPEPTFTGEVAIRGYFRREAPSRLAGATVVFPPGARTPWKTNPAGQTVVVLDGVGRAQSDGEEVVELHAGDVAWFPPGERHWEGADPDRGMTCIAVHETTVEFLEAVTDEQYSGQADGAASCQDTPKRSATQPKGPKP